MRCEPEVIVKNSGYSTLAYRPMENIGTGASGADEAQQEGFFVDNSLHLYIKLPIFWFLKIG